MITLRRLLTDLKFDWMQGIIIYHEPTDPDDEGGWCYDIKSRSAIPFNHPVLDKEFDPGYGSPECPRIIAYDFKAIYFPWQYDGASRLTKVWANPDEYLEDDSTTPYPGG